jgi:hypothetical protein
MSASRADDLIAGVKDAVFRELTQLDPRAQITSTNYFNHSFIPDFVISWHDGFRETTSRDIYLRTSLQSTTAGRDIEALAEKSPGNRGPADQ